MSSPARCPPRAALLQSAAWLLFASGLTGSLAYVPGINNPADPISRARVVESTVCISYHDVALAEQSARTCRITPAAAVLGC